MRRNAFTLIELLVVITIITILIAVLLPALSAARTEAQSMSSMSQMRQIQMLMHQYVGDHNGVFPHSRGGRTSVRPYWSQRLVIGSDGNSTGYISAQDALKLFWSPGKTKNYAKSVKENNPGYNNKELFEAACYRTDYSVNEGGAMPQYGSSYTPIKIYQPNLPTSKLMTFTQSIYANTGSSDDGFGKWRAYYAGSTQIGLFTFSGSVVTGYIDGHSKQVKGSTLGWIATGPTTGKWDPTFLKTANAPWYYEVYTK